MRKILHSKILARIIACYGLCSYFISEVQAQVYNGSVTILTQADVNAFNYTAVTGSITITPFMPTDITNLDGLSELTTVGSSLTIRSTAIPNLNGLSNLSSIGGDLGIFSNTSLSSIDGLSNLSQLGSLSIDNNPALSNVNGLSKIYVLGGLTISREPISNMDGLMNLTVVNGRIDISTNKSVC